jgi:anti-sigma factor RsiW
MTGRAPECIEPIEFEALIAYWLDELPPAVEAPLEEHLFGCAECTQRLEDLAALAAGIRAAVREGTVFAVVSAAFLESMEKAGLRLRQYRVAPGASVRCTLRAEDDALISRLEAPLAGVKRLDMLQAIDEMHLQFRLEDLPFDPAAGEVVMFPSSAALRKMPAHTFRLRLLAVDDAGDRVLGDYTFRHAPDKNP